MDSSLKSSKRISSNIQNLEEKTETNNVTNDSKNDASGHRKRVREKFMKQDISQFPNLEIIEAILFFCNPRKDVKQEARILNKISNGSVLKFIFLEMEDIKNNNIKYVGENLIFLTKIMRELISRYFLDKIPEITFRNLEEVSHYLISRSAFLKREEVRVLFLNAKNKLIDDIVVFKGTVNEVPIYPAEIVTLATGKRATSILLSHNHPSGDAKASEADLQMTYQLRQALALVGIMLQDHIIVSESKSISMAKEGLL
jgi:DNA repair protein RadC